MKAAHRLVGYDRQTELEKFELPIPEQAFGEIRTVVPFDDDDPDAIGCYELTDGQALQIASMARQRSLPAGLDFFLEAYAP
jgi:hypothetical protein